MERVDSSRSVQLRVRGPNGPTSGPPASYMERISCPIRRRFYESLGDACPKRKSISARHRKSFKIDQTNKQCPCAGEPAVHSSRGSDTEQEDRVKVQERQRLFCSRDSCTNTPDVLQDSQSYVKRSKKKALQKTKPITQCSGKHAMVECIRQWERSLREARRKQTYVAPKFINKRISKRSGLDSSNSSKSTVVGNPAATHFHRRPTRRRLSSLYDNHCSHNHQHESVVCPVHGVQSMSSVTSTVRLAPRRQPPLKKARNEIRPSTETNTKKPTLKRLKCRTGNVKQNKIDSNGTTIIMPTNDSLDGQLHSQKRQKIRNSCHISTCSRNTIDKCGKCRQNIDNSRNSPSCPQRIIDNSLVCRQKIINNAFSSVCRQKAMDDRNSPPYRQRIIDNNSLICRQKTINNSFSSVCRQKAIDNRNSPPCRQTIIDNTLVCRQKTINKSFSSVCRRKAIDDRNSPSCRQTITDNSLICRQKTINNCQSPTCRQNTTDNYQLSPIQRTSGITEDNQNFSSQFDVENEGNRVRKDIQKTCIPVYLTRRSRSPFFNKSRPPYFNKKLCYRVAKEDGLGNAAMCYGNNDLKITQQLDMKSNASGFQKALHAEEPTSQCFVIRTRGKKDRILTKRPLRHMDIKPSFAPLITKSQIEELKQSNLRTTQDDKKDIILI